MTMHSKEAASFLTTISPRSTGLNGPSMSFQSHYELLGVYDGVYNSLPIRFSS